MPFIPLLHALARGALVLTPTNRLQRDIIWLYNRYHAQGVTPKPKCLTYNNWLKNWHESYDFKYPKDRLARLIDDWQLQLIWKQQSQKTLKPHEVKQMMSVVKNCALSLSEPKGSDFLYTPHAQEFQNTWQNVSVFLKEQNWIAPFQLANLLCKLSYPDQDHTPEIIWACFDYLHPEQQMMHQHLNKLGIPQYFYDFNNLEPLADAKEILDNLVQIPNKPRISMYAASEEQVEHEQLINWIQNLWSHGTRRIGVVVPDLSQQKAKLQHLLKEYLPEEHLHFSLGQPLTEFPIIKLALALLELDITGRLTRHQCRLLLHTPFIHLDAFESEKRQKIYQKERLLQEPELHFHDFIKACEPTCPKWSEQLKQIAPLPKQASPADWITIIQQRWRAFGFPGRMSLDDNNQQILQKLYQTVMQLHRSQAIISEISFEDLLIELGQLCAEQIHQPPQNYYGIHIMGWLESSGFAGDALWICHMHSQLLPQPVQYTPHLPLNWQKQHQLPRTNSEKEYQLACQMLHRLMHGQDEVVISYACHKEQEPLWPSPILPTNLGAYQELENLACKADYEILQDGFLVPMPEEHILGGGTGLLGAHAQCPFQAFAKYRLRSEDPDKEQFGLNHLERGNVIHEILQQIWIQLKNQQTLLSFSDSELEKLVRQTIKACMTPLSSSAPYSFDPLCLELEQDLLFNKIIQALEVDKKRPAFQIKSLEQDHTLELDSAKFNLRFDRVDELPNGKHILIDYKMNTPSPLPWTQERPIHPQMLMYALADKNLSGLMFMPINKPKDKAHKHSGIAMEKLDIDGVNVLKEDWQLLQNSWNLRLETYVQEIKTGQCQPTPSNASCRNCIHQDLCRVQFEVDLEED